MDLPLALYNIDQVKALEKVAYEKYNLSPYQLMCRAGQAAFGLLQANWKDVNSIAVCCGLGNNGGDGLVLARLAKAKGLTVNVYQVGDLQTERLSSEAKQARQDWLQQGGEIIPFSPYDFQGELIIDAILGTGVRSPLPQIFTKTIQALNQTSLPILSIDVPSGLNADTGEPLEAAINAKATITFIGLKIGLLTGKAPDFIGELFFDNLGIPSERVLGVTPKGHRLDYNEVIQALPKRHLSSHKGDFGHVCVIGGGQTGFSGAVCLAGEAALRTGAGLVSAVIAPESMPLMARSPMELMCHGLSRPKDLKFLLEKANVIVLGPGLGQTTWSKIFFRAALAIEKPCVVDADGLNWLAKLPHKRENWVLTPHPKEAARLLGKTTEEIQRDRIKAAQSIAQKYGGVTVLKGAGTIICDESDQINVSAGGYPILGSGGTGDVLSGIIGGLLAQGLSLRDAAKLGVNIHLEAAKLEQTLGDRGMIASDLFLHIRTLLNPTHLEQMTCPIPFL